MKVAVITLQAVANYGSVLQALATQELLKNHGLEVEIVNYVRKDIDYSNLIKQWCGRNVLKKIVIFPTIQKWKSVFRKYCYENLQLSQFKYSAMQDFATHPLQADLYCTGSDQVWNSVWNKGILPEFYLAFAPKKSYKFALAASIGKDHIDQDEIKITMPYIKNYNLISMRESSATEIIAKQYKFKDVRTVIDPTLGFPANWWKEKMETSHINYKYILLYNLNRSKEFDNYAKKLAKKTGYKLVCLCTRYDQFYRVGHSVLIPTIPKFISLIANAEYVLTDSFHATAFSINMNTEPICISPPKFESRLVDFLNMVNLSERLIRNYDDFEILNHKINFQPVNAVLDKKRKELNAYIDNVICDAKNYYGMK